MKAIAEKLLSYYQKMESRYGGDWKANFDAAAKWLSLINNSEQPSDGAIEELLTQLNAATAHHGTAWEEMRMHIQEWVKSIKEKRGATSMSSSSILSGLLPAEKK